MATVNKIIGGGGISSSILTESGVDRLWKNITNNFEPHVEGKGLSTNDFTDDMKNSLETASERITMSMEDTYIVKGSVTFANLPTERNEVGYVYNILDEFTTDERFIDNERDKTYKPGTNIVYTSNGWDVLGNTYDFTDYIMKEDISPVDSNDILTDCVLPETVPIITVKSENESDPLVFTHLQENINFDTKFSEPQTITLDSTQFGRNLEYAITDTPVVSTFRMRKAKTTSPYDSLDWTPYEEPFTLGPGNWIIYVRITTREGELSYTSSNGIHIHGYSISVQDATCTENAFRILTCDMCNEFYKEEIQNTALGHAYNNGEITTPATCFTTGVKIYTCTRPGCNGTKTETLPKNNDHTWDSGAITTPATCTTTGVKTFTCTRCNGTRTESVAIDPNNHDYVCISSEPATCTSGKTEKYKCSRCTRSYTSTIGNPEHLRPAYDGYCTRCNSYQYDKISGLSISYKDKYGSDRTNYNVFVSNYTEVLSINGDYPVKVTFPGWVGLSKYRVSFVGNKSIKGDEYVYTALTTATSDFQTISIIVPRNVPVNSSGNTYLKITLVYDSGKQYTNCVCLSR